MNKKLISRMAALSMVAAMSVGCANSNVEKQDTAVSSGELNYSEMSAEELQAASGLYREDRTEVSCSSAWRYALPRPFLQF